MNRQKVPIYSDEGRTYHADSCDPLVAATTVGKLHLSALARGTYPGAPIPDGILQGIRSIGLWDATQVQDWGLPWHRNEGIELTWLETGSMPFQMENTTYQLKPGNLTITRPWQPHKVGNPNVGVGRLHWIILDVGIRQPHQEWEWPVWMVLTPDDISELTQFLRENEEPVWDAGKDMENCFLQIAKTISVTDIPGNASRLAVYINELYLHLLEMFRSQNVHLSKSLTTARRSTELFLDALKGNVAEQWTLESMAEYCGLGVTRFVHYCREITNRTPVQYLNQIRVEKAAALLLSQPDSSVTDIAFECGFSSSQYFATVFKQHYKCTPRAFRKPVRL